MIRSRPLIGPSELCIFDYNSEEAHNLQSHDGLLDENTEEVHNMHHNLQSPDGLLDENSKEVHNLQCPDEKKPGGGKNQCYYPHRSRDLVSPI